MLWENINFLGKIIYTVTYLNNRTKLCMPYRQVMFRVQNGEVKIKGTPKGRGNNSKKN